MTYNYDYLKQKCHQERIRIIKSYIDKYSNPSQKILSVGCGTGIIESQFNRKIFGIDKLVPIERFIDIKYGELENLQEEDNSYDLIFLGEIIEHIYKLHDALKQIKRVLKDDGVIIITTPNVLNLRDRIRSFFGILPRQLGGYLNKNPHLYEHIRFFTKESLTKLLNIYGFDIIDYKTPAININIISDKIIDVFNVPRFLTSLGNNLIIVGRKSKQ